MRVRPPKMNNAQFDSKVGIIQAYKVDLDWACMSLLHSQDFPGDCLDKIRCNKKSMLSRFHRKIAK